MDNLTEGEVVFRNQVAISLYTGNIEIHHLPPKVVEMPNYYVNKNPQPSGEHEVHDKYNNRSGPKKPDSFFRVFKCTVAWGYAALGSGFRL